MSNRNYEETQYLYLLRKIINEGETRKDRTGIGTKSIFSPRQMVFSFINGIPLLTTKRMYWRGIAEELFFFLHGKTNIDELQYIKSWWEPFADDSGDIGPIYGAQYRKKAVEYGDSYIEVDQLQDLIKQIKINPYSRRHILTTYDHAEVAAAQVYSKKHGFNLLPPCHGYLTQFFIDNEKRISMSTIQRSGDFFIGVPVNIASYALFLGIVAHLTGYTAYKLYYHINDCHVYLNHIDAANEQLSREPRRFPTLVVNSDIDNVDDFTYNDVQIIGYDPYPSIKAELNT